MLATHPQNLDKDCVGIYKVEYAPIERTLLSAAALVERRRYLIVVPGTLPAGPRRSVQFDKAGSAATLPQQKNNNSADLQRGGFIHRGYVPGR
jgi:hypothetical protein